MFFDDHKKAVTTIVSRRKANGDKVVDNVPMKSEAVSKTEDGKIDGRHVAAQEILAAHHEMSPQKLMEALSNFIDIHHSTQNAEPDKE